MSEDKTILPRVEVAPLVDFIHLGLPRLPSVLTCNVCGSWRRQKTEVGDLDVAVEIKRGAWSQVQNQISRVLQLEGTKRSGQKYFDGLFCGTVWLNFWLYDDSRHHGAMLLHCTGSGQHNEMMRGKAKGLGFKLNQYGLYHLTPSGGEIWMGGTEEQIFALLGMEFVPPKDREVGIAVSYDIGGNGEVALALHRIGKEYQERAKKKHPEYFFAARFKARNYLDAAKVASALPPPDWEGNMPGPSTLADAISLLERGRCERMDDLGL